MKNSYIIFIMILIQSCGKDWTEHEGFVSDCLVYNHEVVRESLNSYTVEYIDTLSASGCVKLQLKNHYLLNLNKGYNLRVYPKHPKYNLKLIELFLKKHNKPNIRLSSFFRHKNKICLTISKKYFNSKDKLFNNQYFEWKFIYMSKVDHWKIDSTKFSSMLPWNKS